MSAHEEDILECDACADPEACGAASHCYEYDVPLVSSPHTEPRVLNVTLQLCELCLAGAGGECHVPGCALWMNRAPDLPVRHTAAAPLAVTEGEEADRAESARVRADAGLVSGALSMWIQGLPPGYGGAYLYAEVCCSLDRLTRAACGAPSAGVAAERTEPS